MLSSPRLFHHGKYVELANEDEFDYPASVNRNKFLQDNVEDNPFRGKYKSRAHAPFLSKDEKRHLQLNSAREVARRKQFDRFRTVTNGKGQMNDPVDRVITKGLVGKTRVTTNEPHAECIGHNISPIGRRGVHQTRVFQSPPRTGTRKGSHRAEYKVQPNDNLTEIMETDAFKPMSETSEDDLKHTEYPTTSALRRYSESSKRGRGVSSSKSSGITRDVRMLEDRVASGQPELNESQMTGSRSFTVKRKVRAAPHEKSKPQSVSLTAIYESNSEQVVGGSNNFTRKSVKDTVEEVKREAQLRRTSAEVKTDASSTQVTDILGTTLDRKSELAVSHNGTPSASWHSRRLLHSKQTEDNQEELILEHPKIRQPVAKNDTLPSDPSSASEFPPLPSFLYYTDDTPPSSARTGVASQTVVSAANKPSPSTAASQNHVSGMSTTRRGSVQNQSPRKRKLSIDRKAPNANNTDIVDHVQGMLDSISGGAFQQRHAPYHSTPKASERKPSIQSDQNRVTQIASVDSDLGNFTFSPRKTSTPVQSAVDVQKHVRSDRSMIESALEKRRLRIADSNSSTTASASVIHDVRDTVRRVSTALPSSRIASGTREKANSQMAIKARVSPGTQDILLRTFPTEYSRSEMRQPPKRRRTLSTPASPVFALTGHGASGHVPIGAYTAPSSPTSDMIVHEDHSWERMDGTDDESKDRRNASNMKFTSETERHAHAGALPKLSPRGLLLKEIRSRRQSSDD